MSLSARKLKNTKVLRFFKANLWSWLVLVGERSVKKLHIPQGGISEVLAKQAVTKTANEAICVKKCKTFVITNLIILLLFFVKTTTAHAAASLSLSPASGSYTVNSTLTVSVKVNTGGDNISQVKANLSYPSTLLEFQSANKTASFITNWLIEDSSTTGILNYVGGTTSPFNGSNGTFITFNFRVKAAGTAAVNLTTSSYVYKHIPGSTSTVDILDQNSLGGGSYTLTSSGGNGAGGPAATATPTPSQLADAGIFDNTLLFASLGLVLIFLGSLFHFKMSF